MERLTPTKEWRESEGVGYATYLEKELCMAYDKRLSAIEDVLGDHYDIDRLQELVKAKDEGRLVVLPCKVGDTLYTESPIRDMVTSFKAPDLAWIIENISEFGKTVFLTRAEAEAAIGGGGDG